MSSTYTAPPAILGRSEAPQVTARAGAPSPEINGELVVSTNGRLDFDALQKRLVTTSPAGACRLIAAIPASYVAFDLLAIAGVDLRTQRWATRRSRLEQLASDWSPPLQLTP